MHFPDDILLFSSKGDIHMKKLVTEWKQLLLFNKSVVAPVRALGAKPGMLRRRLKFLVRDAFAVEQSRAGGSLESLSPSSCKLCTGFVPGDVVLDCCAAPGNKSVLVAQNCNTLVSCERSEKR